MLKTDIKPEPATPETEQGHWRCVWWMPPPGFVMFRDGEGGSLAADRLGPDEFITPFRFKSEYDADAFGRRAEGDLREQGWTPDKLRYERAEFFPDYTPAAD